MNYQNLYEDENQLINNVEYKNNNFNNPQEFMFNFINRKFFWKELMKIDTKYIERTGDVSVLSAYVQNILYTKLDINNIDLLSEEYIIQLVTLLQLTGQYLVYTQKMLEGEIKELKENIFYLKNNVVEIDKYKRIIENLNKQSQEKDFLIKTYQDMIQNGKDLNIIENGDNKNINLKSVPEINYIKKTYYYCNICLGKKFKTQKYLDDHMRRRHYNFKELIIDKKEMEEKKVEEENYRLEFDEKIKAMKSEFENMIKQKEENNELALINKRFELLQAQIMSQNYNNIINYRANLNYYNKKNYQQISLNKKQNEQIDIEFKNKYEILIKKYNDLLKKYEEKERLEKDFSSQPINIFERVKKNSNEDSKNKKIYLVENITQIEINQNEINDKKLKKSGIKQIDLNVVDIFINGKKTDKENKNIFNNKNEINKKLVPDINLNVNNNLNSFNKGKENKKYLTNDGNETILESKIIKPINDDNKNINNNNKIEIDFKSQNSNNKELKISNNSKKDEDSNNNKNDIILKNQNIKEDNNEIIPPNEDIQNVDKLKIFYNQFENRDKNCLNKEIKDYKKAEDTTESNVDIKNVIKGKKFSEDYIKQYKYYDYLNNELGLEGLFVSLRNRQKTKIQNKVVPDNFVGKNNKNNNKIKKSFNSLEENNNINKESLIIDNQNKEQNQKSINVLESSYIKGFDLIKSTK